MEERVDALEALNALDVILGEVELLKVEMADILDL